MHDPIARTASRVLRRGGLTLAEKRRARARMRAKAEAARRGGYGGGFEEAVNWRGSAGTCRANCRRCCFVSREGETNMLEKASLQKHSRRATSVLVTIPLSWGFVNDLRRSGYLSEQNSHNKEKIGRAVATVALPVIGSPSSLINCP